MKQVMILFGRCRWDKKKPFSDQKYMYSYEYFYSLCQQSGVRLYRASYQWYDYRKKIFKYAWTFENSQEGWKRAYDIKPDLVHDKTKATAEAHWKTSLIRQDYPFFNNPEFTKIIDNKLANELLFPEWSAKNHVIRNNFHLLKQSKKIPDGQRMVLKPINLSGGEGVLIGTMAEIMLQIKKDSVTITDWLLQDFINSSSGIPGIMKGIHDLRLVIIDEKIVYAYYRKPAEGSFLANLAQGGSMEIVPIKKLPRSLEPLIKRANQVFSGFDHKIYALDVMFDQNKKPWIVELNSMPGMYFAPGQEETRKYFYEQLLNIFKEILS